MAEQLLFSAAARFEAARHLSALPARHCSRRLHGHGFLAKLRVQADAVQAGFPGDEVAALRRRLARVVAPLDYASLNDTLDEPSDENLARWIHAQLDLPGIDGVEVQSTPHSGVELDHKGHVHVWRRYGLQSAHRLPHVPPGHKCSRMHGHGFEVILRADHGPHPPQSALACDRLDELWAPLHAELDHACLNDIPGLENPTSERLSNWIWSRVKRELPALSWVVVHETASCGARYDGRRYRIWKEATLDSARQLTKAPEGDKRRNIHGHTYILRLHLQAALDDRMGWTMDFGDVKELFTPVFLDLDHQPLHESVDPSPDIATLARWIRQRTKNVLPQLEGIDLYETPGCGAILSWGDNGPTPAI
ncbi:MAG TPA: 6-carboxytetrahydropterin synthase [Burkholderiales bacterium]|nr:6-carboxytetrahydropterin synthase [Burkholderiales bacterium]